eukprot:SAG11_NODE_49871_length_116_cov_55.588235_1_plen_20_part_10
MIKKKSNYLVRGTKGNMLLI